MHKIKEMLHHDDSSEHSDKHSHSHEHAHLNDANFKDQHVRHGEIEHGTANVVREDRTHERRRSIDKTGEKHVYHERETLRDGDNVNYRRGEDPVQGHEVGTTTSHNAKSDVEHIDESEIVREKVKKVQLHKVQPVVHRDREQREIRHVVEPHQEFEVRDTKIDHLEKDIELGSRIEKSTLSTSRDLGTGPKLENSREVMKTERQHQELPTRVDEHVHRTVEEHVHPVIYKETLRPKVIEEIDHVYETVRERPLETYEVRDVQIDSSGSGDAERRFFETQSARGIDIDNNHHSRDLKRSSEGHKHEHHKGHKHHEHHKHVDHTPEHYVETRVLPGNNATTMTQEPVIGHHQNIGGHHQAAMAAPGHNVAYDAALCNQCTKNPVCSHSEKDAELMQHRNEKKLQEEQKHAEKHGQKYEVV